MANIFDVAKYILNAIGDISTMKLQKLCYYSQVNSLKQKGLPLFKEDFEAWANGPVCRDLFNIHKGKFFLSAKDIPNNLLSSLSLEDKNIINEVIEKLGNFSGTELSKRTHNESPWKNARGNIVDSKNCSRKITKSSMLAFYITVSL